MKDDFVLKERKSKELALMLAIAEGVLATMAALVPTVKREQKEHMSTFEGIHERLSQAIELHAFPKEDS